MISVFQNTPFDIIVHTFCVSKFNISRIFIRVCKYFTTREAWNLKCRVQYPQSKHTPLAFWTPVQNYLVCSSKTQFAVAVNFSPARTDIDFIPSYVYQYTKAMDHFLRITGPLIDFENDHENYELVKFNIKKRFVVIERKSSDGEGSSRMTVRGQFSTKESANKRAIATPEDKIYTDEVSSWTEYVVLDLKKMTPWFLKYPQPKKSNKKNYTFSRVW